MKNNIYQNSSLLELVLSSLPLDFDGNRLKALVDPDMFSIDQRGACIDALRKCSDINWEAYLSNNPDVEAAGIDPVLHFLSNGVFEGRRLWVWFPYPADLQISQLTDRPKISVIVPNYNKGKLLKSALASLRYQSLGDMEFIVVDNGSNDNSKVLIRSASQLDHRIKSIFLRENRSQHMARKIGVAVASGRYIMFLDSDDMLMPDACERAYDAIRKGFDIVCFNSAIRLHDNIYGDKVKEYLNYINRGTAGQWHSDEITERIFFNQTLSDLLWNKIFDGNLCKYSFNEMEDGFFDRGEDIYETLVLTSKARSIRKIEDILYIYRVPVSYSLQHTNDYIDRHLLHTGDIWPVVRRYLTAAGINNYYSKLSQKFLAECVEWWLKQTNPRIITAQFNEMAKNFGIEELIVYIATRYLKKWHEIADVFQHYMADIPVGNHKRRNIGIIYICYAFGGAERVTLDMCCLLRERGYNVTLFLERPHTNDATLPDDINVIYLPMQWYYEKEMQRNIYAFSRMLKQHEVDVLFFASCWDQPLLWQAMLARYLGIGVIMHNHMAFYDRLLSYEKEYDMENHYSVFRCADKVVCLSKYAELYNRIQNIDAEYVPDPVYEVDLVTGSYKERCREIVIFGRFGDASKRVPDALKALGEIVKFLPDIKATFVGSLGGTEDRKQFWKMVNDLDLKNNIRITGWTNEPLLYVARAGVLLSTAYQESFALTICQAQTLGLPCVMYELPIMPAENNSSIIQVKHGDYKAAAREIIALLSDEARWEELSMIARENVRKFSPEVFIGKIIKLVDNYDKKSYLSSYDPLIYQKIMKTIGIYAGDVPPWFAEY